MTATILGRRRRRRLPEWARPWVLLGPALLVLAFLFVGALAFGVLQSLNIVNFAGEADPGFDAYVSVLGDDVFWRSLGLSLWIAFISTALSIVLAVGTALLIHAGNGAETLVELSLTAERGGVTVALCHSRFANQAECDRHDGWRQSFDQLETWLAERASRFRESAGA